MTWTRIRKGRAINTTINDGHSENKFHEIDDLDTRSIDTAADNYEKVFMTIRDVLSTNEQYCCDDEADRLSIAQVISDTLRRSALIRKDLS
jgi:hypothetical protein